MTSDNFDAPQILQELRDLKAKVETITRRNTKLARVSNAAPELGDMDVRLADGNGILRFVISGVDLETEIGVNAYLAALSEYGYPTAWIDADTGDMVAAGGNAKMTDRGILAKSVPIIFEGSDDRFLHYLGIDEHYDIESGTDPTAKFYNLLIDTDTLGSNLIVKGDFSTGWDSDWDATGTYEVIDYKTGNALNITAGNIVQEIAVDNSSLYMLKADVLGEVIILALDLDSTTERGLLVYSNSFSAWTQITLLFRVNTMTAANLSIAIYGGLIIETSPFVEYGDGSVANVTVQKVADATGFIQNVAEDKIYTYGDLVDETGDPIVGATATASALAFMQLANSKGDVYDPGTSLARVDSILLCNANTSSETIELYLHDGTNEYKLYKKVLVANETVHIPFDDSLIVNAASKITGNTTTASKVTCLVIGSIQTAGANLAFIQLANAKGDVYDPGAANANAKMILLHNANTTSETVTLYLHNGTNEYQILKVTLIAGETVWKTLGENGLPINSSSKITGKTTTAAKVTCLIMGTAA